MVNFVGCGERRVRGFSIISFMLFWSASTCGFFTGVALADGMLPETTVVVLYEEEGEATINITEIPQSGRRILKLARKAG